MRVVDIILGFATFNLLLGVWQFIYLMICKSAYETLALKDETFFEFMSREYKWGKWRERLRIFYNSDMFIIFQRLKGIILVLMGVLLYVIYFVVKFSDYASYLYETF